jgi:hypothetical protein
LKERLLQVCAHSTGAVVLKRSLPMSWVGQILKTGALVTIYLEADAAAQTERLELRKKSTYVCVICKDLNAYKVLSKIFFKTVVFNLGYAKTCYGVFKIEKRNIS